MDDDTHYRVMCIVGRERSFSAELKLQGGRLLHFVGLATTAKRRFTRHLEYGEKQHLSTVDTPLLKLPG